MPGKSELVAPMPETATGEPPVLDGVPGGGRPKLDVWARLLSERFRGHSWGLEVTAGARPVGPYEFGWLEQAVAALAGTGRNGGEMLGVAATLGGHAARLARQAAAAGGDAPDQTMSATLGALLRDHPERFPSLRVHG